MPARRSETLRLPRERMTDAVRPRQWPYFQAVAGSVIFFGLFEAVFTYCVVTNYFGEIGNYDWALTTGCFWDGAAVSAFVLVFFFIVQYLLYAKNRHGASLLKVFTFLTFFVTLALIILFLAKVFAWLTLMGVKLNSCSHFKYRRGRGTHATHIGTCFSKCVPVIPEHRSSCCCCSSFSLTSSNVTVFDDAENCSELLGLPTALYSASILFTGVLCILCIVLVVVQLSLCRGCCGPRFSDLMAPPLGERQPLTSEHPPSYAVTPSAPPSTLPGEAQRQPYGTTNAVVPHGALSLDLGPPPAYQDTWGRQHPISPRHHA